MYEHTDFDTLSLTSSADADGLSNTIRADVDVTAIKFAVGKKF